MKKLAALFLAGAMLLTAGCSQAPDPTEETTAQEPETTEQVTLPQNTLTGEELMQDMKIGWNLGNTFDAPDGEISWGNPVTTKEMIEYVKSLGFNTIRIPITWNTHVGDAPEYTIDEGWMKRVDTVVNYALDAGMYVIINSHHDNGVYTPIPENEEHAKQYLAAIWKQIAEHFADKDHHLIFQGMNEPRVEGTSYEWNVDTKNADCMASIEVVNQLNQTVVNTVRAAGGYNADRFIIVSPYVANAGAAVLSSFRLPDDPAGKLIVSIHAYTPYDLCLSTDVTKNTFTKQGVSDIKSFMMSVNRMFVQKGVPVIIDEMGIVHKDNPDAKYEWAKTYVSLAKEYGMVCVWWDNGATTVGTESFGIVNRRKLSIYEQSQSVYEGLMAGLEEQA